jgi:ribosomal 50S subunit-recycling heat shock protein
VAGRITHEGKALKPGYVVRLGDVITLHYARKVLTVRVLLVPERVTPALRALALYEIIEEHRDDPADWLT